ERATERDRERAVGPGEPRGHLRVHVIARVDGRTRAGGDSDDGDETESGCSLHGCGGAFHGCGGAPPWSSPPPCSCCFFSRSMSALSCASFICGCPVGPFMLPDCFGGTAVGSIARRRSVATSSR